MKAEINKKEVQKFNHHAIIFNVLFALCIISVIPLIRFFGLYGGIANALLFIATFIFSLKIEKMKKANNIHTFKEIVAFCNGQPLAEIPHTAEKGKRFWQKILLGFSLGIILFALTIFLMVVLKL